MPGKVATSPDMPCVGTVVDGRFELLEVLGVGGYGIVYRAVDRHTHQFYAIKCLARPPSAKSARQRQMHLREITLHQLASANDHVISLHQVVEDGIYTFIIMEFASDGDLFSQILTHKRYLGKDNLIRHIFLQLLDAVEYIHALGIYHRDLKPENILCKDGGLRVALTDFGLATTDKLSQEFRTGSVYHMSPECFAADASPITHYSPQANDVWSLAVVLINLTTGRNPWKSASRDDPTFHAYLSDPEHFIPTVLPLSDELNALLVRMLEIDWRRRATLPEIRRAITHMRTFYSPGAVLEGSMARCPWEVGLDLSEEEDPETVEAEAQTEAAEPATPVDFGNASEAHATIDSPESSSRAEPQSHWSQESGSDSEMVFASASLLDKNDSSWTSSYSQHAGEWGLDEIAEAEAIAAFHETLDMAVSPDTPPSIYSPMSSSGSGSIPSMPTTPGIPDRFQTKALRIDTGCLVRRHGHDEVDEMNVNSPHSSLMRTAVESYTGWTSPFFVDTPAKEQFQETFGVDDSSTFNDRPRTPTIADDDEDYDFPDPSPVRVRRPFQFGSLRFGDAISSNNSAVTTNNYTMLSNSISELDEGYDSDHSFDAESLASPIPTSAISPTTAPTNTTTTYISASAAAGVRRPSTPPMSPVEPEYFTSGISSPIPIPAKPRRSPFSPFRGFFPRHLHDQQQQQRQDVPLTTLTSSTARDRRWNRSKYPSLNTTARRHQALHAQQPCEEIEVMNLDVPRRPFTPMPLTPINQNAVASTVTTRNAAATTTNFTTASAVAAAAVCGTRNSPPRGGGKLGGWLSTPGKKFLSSAAAASSS